jgi:adenylate cyclase
MIEYDTQAIVDWLVDGARSTLRSDLVLAELCDRLVDCGIPIWRAAVFVRTLHPDVMGRLFQWQVGSGVTTSEAPFDFFETAASRASPVIAVYATGHAVRRRLADKDCPDDFAMLRDFRAQGVTDYVAFPLAFTDGSIHAATWSTRQPGGFSPAQFSGLAAIVTPLARVAEVRALRRTASNFLDTYVGNQAGERILAGQIRRGHTETIHAAIWLSDMRGFTLLADRLPPQELVDLLNLYFDCQVPAILRHGGEVLKFMGDGLLAIFPIGKNDADTGKICKAALAAARDARAKVDALARAPGIRNVEGLRFGLALHVGNVLYGNIGGGNRLDFTCIGPAVNLAARLEKLAAKLGRTIVASAEFSRHCPGELQPVGDFIVAGFAASQTVFGVAEETAASQDMPT